MDVKCPKCRQLTKYSPENPFRPFCSERCQTLDLGAWADEQYRVPGEEIEPTPVNSEDTADAPREANSRPPKHRLN